MLANPNLPSFSLSLVNRRWRRAGHQAGRGFVKASVSTGMETQGNGRDGNSEGCLKELHIPGSAQWFCEFPQHL